MNCISRNLALSCTLVAAAALSACGTSATSSPSVLSTPVAAAPAAVYGTVSSIDVVAVDSGTTGIGAIVGGVLGAVVGHQVGGGTGKALATGAGAVGGALAGNEVEKRRGSNTKDVYRVSVRLDNGDYQQFKYESVASLRVGDRVRVENGQVYEL